MYVERFRGNLGQVKLLGIKKAKDLNNLQKTRNNKGKALIIDLYMHSFVKP